MKKTSENKVYKCIMHLHVCHAFTCVLFNYSNCLLCSLLWLYGNCCTKHFTWNFFPWVNTPKRTWLLAKVNVCGSPDLTWDKDTSWPYKSWSSTKWGSCCDFPTSLGCFPFGCFTYIAEGHNTRRPRIIPMPAISRTLICPSRLGSAAVWSPLLYKPLDYSSITIQ